MNKISSIFLLGILIFSLGAVSAKTMISGKIYNSDFTGTINEANVTISCEHKVGDDIFTNIRNAISLSDGTYSVEYNEAAKNGCDDGDIVTVTAKKNELHGVRSGIVHENVVGTWDVGVVNVPMVPEFGLFIGILTLVSVTGIFFVIRKN